MDGRSDPLRRLGADVFHMILGHVDMPDLVAAERVCRSWRRFSLSQTLLWRRACRASNVDMNEYARWRSEAGMPAESNNMWRDAALSHLVLVSRWRATRAYPKVYPNYDDDVCDILPGPEDGMLTLVAAGPSCRLSIVDKYTGAMLYVVDDLPVYARTTAGGGYLVVSDAPMVPRPQLSAMGPNLGTLTVWRTPAARARAGQPPLDLHRTREGYAKLEEWTALEWMGQCECMTIHVDDKDSREPKPVLVAAKRSEIYVCYLDEGLRRYKIDIRALDVHSFGDFNEIRLDDEYIYLTDAFNVCIISRRTRAPLVSYSTGPGRFEQPVAAVAYKFTAETLMDLYLGLPACDTKNADGTANFRTASMSRVTQFGSMSADSYICDEPADEDGWVSFGGGAEAGSANAGADTAALSDGGEGPGSDTPAQSGEGGGDGAGRGEDGEDGEGGGEEDQADNTSQWESDSELPLFGLDDPDSDSDWEDDPEPEDWRLRPSPPPSSAASGPAPITWSHLRELSSAPVEPQWSELCFTSTDMVVRAGQTALVVIRNYRHVLAACERLPTQDERAALVAAHSIIIAFPYGSPAGQTMGVHSVSASGDFIVVHEASVGICLIDTKNLPTLPTKDAVPHVPAAVLTLPWFERRRSVSPTSIFADSRNIYFADASEGMLQRHSDARAQALAERWAAMMGDYPRGVAVWSFRPETTGQPPAQPAA